MIGVVIQAYSYKSISLKPSKDISMRAFDSVSLIIRESGILKLGIFIAVRNENLLKPETTI